MSKEELNTPIRNEVLDVIRQALAAHFDVDAIDVSGNEIAIPVLDSAQNEKFALVKVSIPRGTRDGQGGYIEYDAYAAAEEYRLDMEEKKAKKAAADAKKAAKIAADNAKRAAKQKLKENTQ